MNRVAPARLSRRDQVRGPGAPDCGRSRRQAPGSNMRGVGAGMCVARFDHHVVAGHCHGHLPGVEQIQRAQARARVSGE
jgi:hypothetical protein